MIKKYLIVGDVHWSQYSSIVRKRSSKYSVRLEKLIDSLNWVEQFANENNCDEEIFLGDFMDRADLNAEEITAIQDINWNNLPKTFLVGNHESNIASLDFSSTKLFESIDATVVNEPINKSINDSIDFNFIPYITCDGTIPLTNYIKNKSKKNVIFAHQDIAGLQYGRFLSQSGFDINDIKQNCTLFIDGHLHNEAQFENVVLVGNLTGQNFNENAAIFEHLVYILTINDDKLTMESYVNPYAMNFLKLRIENRLDIAKLNKLKINSVVSVVCDNRFKSNVEEKLKNNSNILEYRLTIFYTNTSSEGNQDYNFKVEDHIQQFANFARQKLAPSLILNDELARLLGGN